MGKFIDFFKGKGNKKPEEYNANKKEESSAKDLSTAISDPDPEIRAAAIEKLGKVGDNAAVDILAGLLKDSRGQSALIAKTLSKIGSERAIDALIAGLENPDSCVRFRVSETLRAIDDARVKAALKQYEQREQALAAASTKTDDESRAENPRSSLMVNAVNRFVVVGLGFQPSDRDLAVLTKLWKDEYPDYPIGKCLISLVNCPPVEGVSDLLEAMKVNWGAAFYERFFEDDFLEGCDLKTEGVEIDDGRRFGVFASYKLPAGVQQSEAVRFIVKLVKARREEQASHAERRPSPVTPPQETMLGGKYASLGSLRSLPLTVLNHQLFEIGSVGQTPLSIREKEKIHRLVASATYEGQGHRADFLALEEATRDLPLRFPDFALGYLWRVVALTGLGRFDEAYMLLEHGFEVCSNVRFLCRAFAYIFEKQGRLEQFGWYMQDCLQGSDDYWSYLVLAQVASFCGMVELSRRLFDSTDILCPGIYRPDPKEITRIDGIVKANLEIVSESLKGFATEIDSQLPPLGLLPEDLEERRLWLMQRKEDREFAKKKLLSGEKTT